MSDRQAQELCPQSIPRGRPHQWTGGDLPGGPVCHYCGTRKPAPVQVERPDEGGRAEETAGGYRPTDARPSPSVPPPMPSDAAISARPRAARLPERPDEGENAAWEEWQKRIRDDKAGRLGYVSHRDHFTAGFLASRPADEGITEAMVEAAAKVIANEDGWDWHDDDYRSPDPKWKATDRDEFRVTAQEALKAALAARPPVPEEKR